MLAVKKFRHMLDGREFTLKTDHKSLIPSLIQEKTSDSDRQQRQLAFLAEMTANFQYIAGPLNAVADAMSRLPQAEEDSDEVCAILQEDIPRHWDEQELLAAHQAYKETLLAADRLVSTKQFAWPKQRGGPMKLLRRPKSSLSPHSDEGAT